MLLLIAIIALPFYLANKQSKKEATKNLDQAADAAKPKPAESES